MTNFGLCSCGTVAGAITSSTSWFCPVTSWENHTLTPLGIGSDETTFLEDLCAQCNANPTMEETILKQIHEQDEGLWQKITGAFSRFLNSSTASAADTDELKHEEPLKQDVVVSDTAQAQLPHQDRSQVIIFDFGGVMGKSNNEQLAQFFENELPLDHSSAKKLVKQVKKWKASLKDFWDEFSKRRKTPLPENWLERYEEAETAATIRDPEVLKIVKEVQANGYRTAMLSNTTPARARRFRDVGIYDDFEPVVLSCEIHAEKPTKLAYELFRRYLQVPPEKCLLIDDKPTNAAGAENSGYQAIVFTSAEDLRKELIKRSIL